MTFPLVRLEQNVQLHTTNKTSDGQTAIEFTDLHASQRMNNFHYGFS